MADTLGLHLGAEGITAVRLDAVGGTPAVVIMLGDDRSVAACLVVQDRDGSVVVGDAARHLDGPVVDDPLGVAAAGRIGALGAVINHAVGRAATAGGTAPRRVAVVVPDQFDAAARDRVVEAGTAAGVADTITVPFSIASTQTVDVDAQFALAAGAARVASLAAAPLVTREDLGESIAARRAAVAPSETPSGSTSVFDEQESVTEPSPEPPRTAPVPVPAQVRDAPITAEVPATRPTAAPSPETLRYEPPRRRIPAGAIVAVVLVGLIAAVGGALAFFGDDGTTTDPNATTTPAPTGSDLPPLTTEPAPITSDPNPSTTADPSATTEAPTTTNAPTTTRPVAVGSPGEVTLAETGLRLRGGDLVLFGQEADSVVAVISETLGEPDRDTDYEASEFCEGERTRFVVWGDLELVFTEDEPDTGAGRFSQWFADGFEDPEGLVTLGGVGVSATVAYLELTFGDALVLVAAVPGDAVGLFAATNPGSGEVLNGTTTTRDPNGVVTALWAGDSCTRIAT